MKTLVNLEIDNIIASAIDTRNDCIWIANGDKGVIRYNVTERTIDKTFNTENSGLPSNVVTAIMVDEQNGNIWFGTKFDNGVVVYDGTNWTLYNEKNTGVSLFNIFSIAKDQRNNIIWFASWGAGLIKFDITKNEWTIYNTENSKLPVNRIWSVNINEKTNDIWLCTDKGAVRYDGENWTIYDSKNTELQTDIIWSIAFDYKNNNIWFGTDGGIALFDNSKSWTIYNAYDKEDIDYRPFLNYPIHAIAIDEEYNSIWFGTAGCGIAVKFDDNTWESYNTKNDDEFLSDFIQAIRIDKQKNRIWIETNEGIFAV